jgi:hypothetical protein
MRTIFFLHKNDWDYKKFVILTEELLTTRNLSLNQKKTKMLFKPIPETLLF